MQTSTYFRDGCDFSVSLYSNQLCLSAVPRDSRSRSRRYETRVFAHECSFFGATQLDQLRERIEMALGNRDGCAVSIADIGVRHCLHVSFSSTSEEEKEGWPFFMRLSEDINDRWATTKPFSTIATAYNGLVATLVNHRESNMATIDATYSEGEHAVVFRIVRCAQPWYSSQDSKIFCVLDAESSNNGTFLTHLGTLRDGDLVGVHLDMDQGIATVSVNGTHGPPTRISFANAKLSVSLSSNGVHTAEIVPSLCSHHQQ